MINELPPAIFISGSTGIDFLNSVATPMDEVVEWIGNGKDLIGWLKQARILTAHDIAVIESNFSAGELDQIALRARELREWFRGFIGAHRGKALSPRALTKLVPLNELLGQDQVFWSIVPGTATNHDLHETPSPLIFRLRPQRRWRTPESVLASVAEELAKVVCCLNFEHIKGCQGKKCTLLFYDETPRHQRRWCDMAICGNRAKQEAFRQRANS
ncbi:MAG TPA: CGNR zinc finger domain-containing protein [Verrucomicrobiae bacterium]|nr:CGNR zinc finger domain-containing protein [Verrucomicrobiae bacterium]